MKFVPGRLPCPCPAVISVYISFLKVLLSFLFIYFSTGFWWLQDSCVVVWYILLLPPFLFTCRQLV
jgi:hypothetical protein